MIVRLLNNDWKVTLTEQGYRLDIVDPKPTQLGRTVLVTATSLQECSRDGKGTPLATFGNSKAALEKIRKAEALAAAEA